MSIKGDKTQPEDEVPLPNPQHVEWLNEGVERWNRRRKEEPFKPVLTRVCFDDEELAGLDRLVAEGYTRLGAINDFSGVNLSQADLRMSILGKGVFRYANFSGADLTKAYARQADFGRADFRGANLWELTAPRAKFDRSVFWDQKSRRLSGTLYDDAWMDPKNAQFNWCELENADFGKSNLDGLELLNCDLSDARLDRASMVGTLFGDSKLWRSRFFDQSGMETGFKSVEVLGLNEVRSIRDLVKLRRKLLKAYAEDADYGRVRFYFRGEPCARWALQPTVMRGRRGSLRLFESHLLTRLKTESPAAFSGCEYAIDELSIARHFGLPSRLLDVTQNPLVGAFWATEGHEKREVQPCEWGDEGPDDQPDCSCTNPDGICDGRLHVFAFPRKNVCAYDSDRVSIVANLARLLMVQQEVLLTKSPDDVNFTDYSGYGTVSDWPRVRLGESMTTLLHNIRKEKPYFAARIDIRDLFRVFVVEPRRSFDRIRAQSGAFMLSAFHERFEDAEVAKSLKETKLYDHHVLTIPAGTKYELREELDWFGINAQTLKADVETTADAVANRFRELAKRRDDQLDDCDSGRIVDEHMDERGG